MLMPDSGEEECKFSASDARNCISVSIENLNESNIALLFQNLDCLLEDPTTIDPAMPTWFATLGEKLESSLKRENIPELELILSVYNHFIKICGIRSIRTYFPVSPELSSSALRVTTRLIETSEDWAARSMCFVWMSLVVLSPFPIKDQDLFAKLIDLARKRLGYSGKECTCASAFLSAAARKSASSLSAWLDPLFESVSPDNANGLLFFFIDYLKYAPFNSALCPYLDKLDNSVRNYPAALTKALYLRFLSYFSLHYWTCNEELPQLALHTFLQELSCRDTKVRWKAAKGIGRLTKLLDEESLASVLVFLVDRSSSSPDFLHGSCLALGQIFSYGDSINIESQHEAIFAHLERCLKFEVSKGTYSIGTNVRDAACYCAWSLCKYQPCEKFTDELIVKLASSLLSLSLFDREISCRRSGSAAFQELVGRSNRVPKGLEILSKIDYFSISSLRNCFLEHFPSIYDLGVYSEVLVGHLLCVSAISFDKNVRILTASAIGKTLLNEKQIKQCFELALDETDPKLVHSGLLLLSELLNSGIIVDLDPIQESFLSFSKLPNSRLPGYQLIAEGWLTLLVAGIASGKWDNAPDVERIIAILTLAFRSRFPDLHSDFCISVLDSLAMRLPENDPLLTSFFRTVVLPAADKDCDSNAQRGFACAISSVPAWLLKDRLNPMTNLLCRLSTATSPFNDVDKRAIIIKAMSLAYFRLLPCEIPLDISLTLFNNLIANASDQSVDDRGDVGSFIRESALQGLCNLLGHFNEEQRIWVLAKLFEQSLERLERVRQICMGLINSNTWPAPLNDLKKFSDISDLLTFLIDTKMYLVEPFKRGIISGWISSAGCPTPSVSEVPMAKLLPLLKDMIPAILDHQDLWDHKKRLCRPLLAVLHKLKASNPERCEYDDQIVDCIGRFTLEGCRSVPVLIDAVQLLKVLNSSNSNTLLKHLQTTCTVPKVRQMCFST